MQNTYFCLLFFLSLAFAKLQVKVGDCTALNETETNSARTRASMRIPEAPHPKTLSCYALLWFECSFCLVEGKNRFPALCNPRLPTPKHCGCGDVEVVDKAFIASTFGLYLAYIAYQKTRKQSSSSLWYLGSCVSSSRRLRNRTHTHSN